MPVRVRRGVPAGRDRSGLRGRRRGGGGGLVLDRVASLVGKSLLRESDDDDGEPRLWMLQTIQEYALQRLAELGAEDDVRSRHAAHFLALAEQSEPKLRTAEELLWLDRLDRENDNIRAALEFALDRDATTALRLVGSLWRFWGTRGHSVEGLRWTRRALKQVHASPSLRARALTGAGWLEYNVGDAHASARALAEALELYEDVGDARGAAFVLVDRAWALFEVGELDAAREHAETGLARARELGERWTEAYALQLLGSISEDTDEARALLADAETIFWETGDRNFTHVCTANRGWMAIMSGRYEEGAEISLESASRMRSLGNDFMVASCLNNAAQAELLRGRVDEAEPHLRESHAILERLGAKRLAAEALRASAAVFAARGAGEQSGELLGAAVAIMEGGGLRTGSIEERIEAELIAPVRAAFPGAFTTGWERGRTIEPADAIQHALRLHGGSPPDEAPLSPR